MNRARPSRQLTFGLAAGLALGALTPSRARAVDCTGTDVLELTTGCSVLAGNEDFFVTLYGRNPLTVSTAHGARSALNRLIVFVHGYGVVGPSWPSLLFDDGSGGVYETWRTQGVGVLAMAPGNGEGDRIEDDARALRAALLLVQSYRSVAALPIVLIGHSMGGLLARIALAEMEADGIEHGVALYVSYDAPHRGVNVPQGMQNLKVKLDEWAAMREADFIAIDPGWEGVFELAPMTAMTGALDPDDVAGIPNPTSLQAQQMTIQGVAEPAEYPAFMSLLDEVGFPSVRSIGISNGNTQGIGNDQAVAQGGELFYFTGAKGNSAASVRGTFRVLTDDPGERCFESDVYYDGFLRNHDGGEKNADTPAASVLMDHFSGGTLDYAAEMLAVAQASEDDFHEPNFRGASDSAIPFVLTSSALGLPWDTGDSAIAGIVATDGTPFDAVFAIGDLPAFSSNLDHNTLVLPDAVVDEITELLTCPLTQAGQARDSDDDGFDDACDDDDDQDGVADDADNCPTDANAEQQDRDADGAGDACDDDDDGDGVADSADNCPIVPNSDQTDFDFDDEGNACDLTPGESPADGSRGPSLFSCGGCSGAGAGLTPALGCLSLWLASRRRRLGRPLT